MPIVIQCPSCSKQATVPDSALGRSARCKCGSSFVVNARNDQALVDELELAASAVPGTPIFAAPKSQPPPSSNPQSPQPSETAPKAYSLKVHTIVSIVVLAPLCVWVLLAVFRASDSTAPSTSTTAASPRADAPVPLWQDSERLKEIAHKMYRNSGGIIDEQSGYKLARAVIRTQGGERGSETLSSLITTVVGCEFSATGKELISAICSGDNKDVSAVLMVMQLNYNQSITEVQRQDCYDAAESVHSDAPVQRGQP